MHRIVLLALMAVAFTSVDLMAANKCALGGILETSTVIGSSIPEKGYIILGIADAYSDEPITDAVVVDRINCKKMQDFPVNEDGQLRIKLREADPDWLSLSFKAPGYIKVSYRYDKQQGLDLPTQMQIYLEKGISIGGYVNDEDGQPIKDVSVELSNYNLDDGEEFRRNIRDMPTKTDAKGYWQLDIWPDDYDAQPQICLKHPDYISDRWGNQSAQPDLKRLKKFEDIYTMKRGLTISGTVTDQDGNPLANALIKSGDDWYPSNHEPGARTNDKGEFKFKAMKPSNWTFTAEYKDLAPQLRTIQIDKNTENIDFVLKPGKTIKIKIVDSKGNPISGAGVAADTWKGKRTLTWRKNTDAQGLVVWTNMPDEPIEYDVYHKTYMSNRNQSLTPGGEEIRTITLSSPLVFNVTVVDAQTNEPIENFKAYDAIKWNGRATPSIQRDSHSTVLGKNGKVEIKRTHGYHKNGLLIEADGYYPKETEYVSADAGSVEMIVKLEKGSNLEVTVLTPEGLTAEDAKILIKTMGSHINIKNGIDLSSSNSKFDSKTDELGKFTLQPKKTMNGMYIMHASGYKLLQNPKLKDLKTITLDKWVTIEGKAMVGNKPFANESMAISGNYRQDSVAYFDYRVNTDSEGRFKFEKVIVQEDIAVYKYIKTGEYSGSYSNRTPVEIKPGDHIKDLIVGGCGRKITGKLQITGATKNLNWLHGRQNLSEKQQSNMPLLLTQIKKYLMGNKPNNYGSSFPIRVYSDGKFEINDVKAGSYSIDVRLYQASENARYNNCDWNKPTVNFNKTLTIPEGDIEQAFDVGVIEVEVNKDGIKYYGIDTDKYSEPVKAETPKLIGKIVTPAGVAATEADVVFCNEQGVIAVTDFKLEQTELPTAKTDQNGEFTFDTTNDTVNLVILHDEGFAILRNYNPEDEEIIKLKPFVTFSGVFDFNDNQNSNKK